MYKKGDAPGKGRYICLRCGQSVYLESDDEKLKACPRCSHKEFRKSCAADEEC